LPAAGLKHNTNKDSNEALITETKDSKDTGHAWAAAGPRDAWRITL